MKEFWRGGFFYKNWKYNLWPIRFFLFKATKRELLNYDTQKELLKETVLPTKALEIPINMDMGAQNQQKIKKTWKQTLSQ